MSFYLGEEMKRLNDATPEEWDGVSPKRSIAGDLLDAIEENRQHPLLSDPISQEDWDAILEDRATENQVGGSHYTELGLQPLEMTYANFGYSGLKASIYTKVNKYLLRDKDSEVEDIEKAIHCLEILKEKAYDS